MPRPTFEHLPVDALVFADTFSEDADVPEVAEQPADRRTFEDLPEDALVLADALPGDADVPEVAGPPADLTMPPVEAAPDDAVAIPTFDIPPIGIPEFELG